MGICSSFEYPCGTGVTVQQVNTLIEGYTASDSTGKIPIGYPNVDKGDIIPDTGSGLPYIDGGVVKIA